MFLSSKIFKNDACVIMSKQVSAFSTTGYLMVNVVGCMFKGLMFKLQRFG